MLKHMRKLQKRLIPTPDHAEELAKIKQIFHELKPQLECSGARLRCLHVVFHGALRAAQEAGLIAQNPTEKTIPPKASAPSKNILNEEQLERLMAEIKMKKEAAVKIDQGIAKETPPADTPQAGVNHTMTDFKPRRGKHRYRGSGYLGQPKGEGHRWNGRYTVTRPDGRKETRNVYADTKEECEKLAGRDDRRDESEGGSRKKTAGRTSVNGRPKRSALSRSYVTRVISSTNARSLSLALAQLILYFWQRAKKIS